MQLQLALLSLPVLAPLVACSVTQDKSPEAGSIGRVVSKIDESALIVFQDQRDRYWFGSDGEGLFCYDGKTITQYTTKDGLCHDHVRSIQEDGKGSLYVTTTNGISKFDGRTFQTLKPTQEESSWRLDPEDLWFSGGQDTGVVYRYDGETLHKLRFPKTQPGEEHIAQSPRDKFPNMKYSPYDVYIIFEDSKGNLWFGTSILGLCRYDGTSFEWVSQGDVGFPGDSFGLRSIAEDEDGKFWFTNTRYRFDVYPKDAAGMGESAVRDRKERGLPSGSGEDGIGAFMSMLKDRDGDLWLAAWHGGVWRYDGQELTHYPVRHGDEDITVFMIYMDNHGALWLGTHEHGAYKFDGLAFEPFRF